MKKRKPVRVRNKVNMLARSRKILLVSDIEGYGSKDKTLTGFAALFNLDAEWLAGQVEQMKQSGEWEDILETVRAHRSELPADYRAQRYEQMLKFKKVEGGV